jgi:NACHT domain
MKIPDYDEHKWVEDEVRRVARQIWPEAQYKGALIVDGLERDGVFETEDCIHLLEATVSRSKDKAHDDGKKLSTLAKKLQAKNPQKAVKGWFVTKEEPTADQRHIINRYPEVVAVSFHQFQSKLVDASLYLNLRENYPFGSVRDPATGEAKQNIDYIPLDFVESGTQMLWNAEAIKNGLIAGKRYVLLGDYGAGKSMTLRELYRELRKAYFKQRTARFPIYLNLRDHFGQTNPAEVLERHGRDLGFPHPAHLVRAWRAGYAILLIDGFDELTTVGIQGLWKRLQETRFRAMQAVREFIRGQPSEVGIALAGRAHFFDSEKERRTSLGITSAFTELTLNEFNDEQIQRYLQKKGLRGNVPAWLPSRPLLVSYLASTGIIDGAIVNTTGVDRESVAMDPARGWDIILDRVCSREAEIEVGIDGLTVRRVLERLASIARSSSNGLGPLSRDQVIAAFSEICGYQPDEKGMILLQRLPGLGIDRADEGTRAFLDSELADVCRAGDVMQFFRRSVRHEHEAL